MNNGCNKGRQRLADDSFFPTKRLHRQQPGKGKDYLCSLEKKEPVDQLEEIRRPIEDDLLKYREVFNAALTHPNLLLNGIFSEMKQRSGKQMRPILLLLTARAFGQPTRTSYLTAVMLELLHTASLVHDDIVDSADQRRGMASVNARYGNNTAVLVGDFLLSTALEHAAMTNNLRIVNFISQLGKQLASGEIIQLSKTTDEALTEDSYYEVIKLKTASLFSAAAELGALSVGASDETVEEMHRLGELIGICFQIKDDILDYCGSLALGKPRGSDLTEGKLTLPLLLALRNHGSDHWYVLARKAHELNATQEEIDALVDFMKDNGGVEDAEKKIAQLSTEALEIAAKVGNPAVRRSLEMYIACVSERNS